MDDPPNRAPDDLLERCSDAPATMPLPVREIAEAELAGEVVYYALSDLDSEFRFRRLWVVLGDERIVLVREAGDGDDGLPRAVLQCVRTEVGSVRMVEGLSCSTMTLVGGEDGSELASLCFTRRYHAMFEGLRAAIEFGLGKGRGAGTPGAADSAYSESLAEPMMAVQPGVAAPQSRVVRRLLGYLRPYRGYAAGGLGAAACVALAGLAPPYLTGELLDSIIDGRADTGLLGGAWGIVALITVAVVMRSLFLWIRLHVMSVLGERVARDLRRDVYGHVQNLGLRYFSRAQTGSVVSRVGSDTDRIWEFITFGIAEAILSGITLLAVGSVLLILDWRLGLIMLAPLPLLLWAIVRNGRGMQRGFTRAWRRWASLQAVIADTIPGIRVVKGFGQEGRERERFERENAAVYETFNSVHASWTRFWPALLLALHGIGVAVYWVALPRIGGTGIPLSAGTFVSFLLYSWMFVQPVETFAQMGRMVNRALSSARRVFELLDTPSEPVVAKGGGRSTDRICGEIEFDDVWFGYQRFRPVLRGVSFRVQAGETLGIAGQSGTGKSSLIQLIPRYYAQDRGRILLDGTDVREYDLNHLRKAIGVVDQEPFLFHGTVWDNIRYGNPDASIGEVIAAARAADAHSFVSRLPLGYETEVGERGHALSGGERQRVSLARTLLCRPQVLILDEATSNLDGESEARIHDALGGAASGSTTIVIAHRLSALRRVDRILFLDDGAIQGEGSFDALFESNAAFRRLYRDQMKLANGKEGLR